LIKTCALKTAFNARPTFDVFEELSIKLAWKYAAAILILINVQYFLPIIIAKKHFEFLKTIAPTKIFERVQKSWAPKSSMFVVLY
jgi:hypothetical protein